MSSVGLTVTRQRTVATSGWVAIGNTSPAEVWANLAESDKFQRTLISTVRDVLTETHHSEREGRLREAGVVAADGGYASIVKALDLPPEHPHHKDALDVTGAFGQPEPSILGHLPLQDVRDGPLAVIGAVSAAPTIELRVDRDFRDARADHRRKICRLISWLTEVADVRMVLTGLMHRWLSRHHRADLPGAVSQQLSAGQGGDTSKALAELNPDGREVRILRDLDDEPTGTLSYHSLRAMHDVTRSRVSQCITRLEDLGLVDVFDGSAGRFVELLPMGRSVINDYDAEVAGQRTDSGGVSTTGQTPGSPVCTPAAHEPTDPAENPTTRFDATYLPQWRHAAAVGSAAEATVTLVDHPINALKDGREPGWSYDDGTLVVSVEYGWAAFQLWVRIALGLANWRTFEHVLTPEVLQEILDEHPRDVLRGARNLGFLDDEITTGEEYASELLKAAEHLRELTWKRHQEQFERRAKGASVIARDSLGLATLMVHLLDLAGVDVVREVRLPEFSRNYGSEERSMIARSVATGIAQQSTYASHHVAYRHLFESREEKRQAALGVDVDAANPLGEPIGNWVIVGSGVDDLEPELRQAIRHPAELHEEAPEFAVPVSIDTPARASFAVTARIMCQSKALEATRESVSVFRGFTGTPYDLALALTALQSEESKREIRLDEVRLSLGTLPPERIIPEGPPTISKLLHALLQAEGPLSQSELAAEANISTRSIRRHADRLAGFDLIRITRIGYRITLPQQKGDPRGGLWYIAPNHARDDDRDATEKGVLWEVVLAGLPGEKIVNAALSRVTTLELPSDARASILDIWPWASGILHAVREMAADEVQTTGRIPDKVSFGANLDQSPLTDFFERSSRHSSPPTPSRRGCIE